MKLGKPAGRDHGDSASVRARTQLRLVVSRSGSSHCASTWNAHCASRCPSAVSMSPTRPKAPPSGWSRTADSVDGAPAAPARIVSIAASVELVEEAGPVVVAQRLGVLLVHHRLHGAVRHRLDHVDGRRQGAQRREVLGAALGVAGVDDDHADRRAALELGRDHRGRRSRHQREAAAQRVGGVGHQVAVGPHDLAGALARPQQHAAEHERADRPQRELELDHDAEVAAAAADGPEQVGVLGLRTP